MQLHIDKQDRYGLHMSTFEAADQALGLRERKNRRTRREIVRATAELTIEGGYASATIPKIAQRADVAPRTVSTWFPTKDEILFENTDDHITRAIEYLGTAPGDLVDRLEAWIDEEISHHAAPDPEIARLRRAAIEHDPDLRARDRQHFERLQGEVARSFAKDTGAAPEDMGPQIVAGATMAFLWRLGSTALEDDPQDAAGLLAEGYALLRATVAAITAERS
jgi:AcrR family transcriptional regulator